MRYYAHYQLEVPSSFEGLLPLAPEILEMVPTDPLELRRNPETILPCFVLSGLAKAEAQPEDILPDQTNAAAHLGVVGLKGLTSHDQWDRYTIEDLCPPSTAAVKKFRKALEDSIQNHDIWEAIALADKAAAGTGKLDSCMALSFDDARAQVMHFIKRNGTYEPVPTNKVIQVTGVFYGWDSTLHADLITPLT